MQQVNVGMIGGGTVGSGVYHALQQNGELLASRLGIRVQIAKIAVKRWTSRVLTKFRRPS